MAQPISDDLRSGTTVAIYRSWREGLNLRRRFPRSEEDGTAHFGRFAQRNHSCYIPELERRVKFEEAISAKRRGWHSPFRTICAAEPQLLYTGVGEKG